MLVVALVLAVVSLAALVTAVVTGNEAIAWACIGLSALGILILIVDAVRDRHHRAAAPPEPQSDRTEIIAPVEATEVIEAGVPDVDDDELPDGEFPDGELADDEYPDDYPDEPEAAELVDYPDFDELEAAEDHPDEVIADDPEADTFSDDEPEYPVPAEEAAVHVVAESDIEFAESDTEVLEEPSAEDHSTTIVYAGASSDESSTVTESYIVIDSGDAVPADSAMVIYADETDADESESEERRGS